MRVNDKESGCWLVLIRWIFISGGWSWLFKELTDFNLAENEDLGFSEELIFYGVILRETPLLFIANFN